MFTTFLIIISLIIIVAVIYIFLTLPRVFDSANMDLLKIDYAHRGLHGGDIPENSLAAYQNAIDNGYGIEIDVQLSSDGEIFVFHDSTATRMCGVDKKIFEMASEEIKSLRLNNTEEHIPTLKEVLALVDGRVPLLIEVKYYAETMKLCASLAEMLDPYYGSFAVQSFDPRVLRYFKKHRPRFARGQLVAKAQKRSERKKSKGKDSQNPIVSFMLSHLLLNVLSRPDFISIEKKHTRELGFVLATEVFKAKAFIWTVKSEKQYDFFRKQGYFSIFENIRPE
jgi:glycerophosphoryl diester phosphodiesterase